MPQGFCLPLDQLGEKKILIFTPLVPFIYITSLPLVYCEEPSFFFFLTVLTAQISNKSDFALLLLRISCSFNLLNNNYIYNKAVTERKK